MLLENKKIVFKPLGVLTHEMLEEVYAAPRRMLALQFDEYGDGIITGLNFKQSADGIILTRGIVKLRAEFFFMTDEVNLSRLIDTSVDKSTARRYHFVLQPARPTFEGGITTDALELTIAPVDVEGLIELGTFETGLLAVKLPPLDAKNFIEALQNNLNLIDVPQSFRGGSTFHSYIFQMIRRLLARKPDKHFFDFVLMSEIDNHAVVSLAGLKNYIDACGATVGDCTRKRLLEKFLEATTLKPPSLMIARAPTVDKPKPIDDDEFPVII